MKKILMLFVLTLALVVTGAASDKEHQSKQSKNSGHASERSKNSGHASERHQQRDHRTRPDRGGNYSQNTGQTSSRNEMRQRRDLDRRANKERERGEKRFNKDRRNAQKHWDGYRFDRRFYSRHFGREHVFFFGGPGFIWYGNPCLFGSYFEIGDVYWGLNYPCSAMWGGYPWDGVYIDEIDGAYFLVNPAYPGVVFGVHVEF